MIVDLNSMSPDTHLNADICIVGAGAAGITLALELIDSGLEVLLLESGGFDFNQSTQNLYSGEIVNSLPPIPLRASRLRFFGGTTTHWAGHCAPFDSIDFQERDWIQGSGWPISRTDLESSYQKAQKLIGLGAFNYDSHFWNMENKEIFDLASTELRNVILQMHGQRFGVQYRETLSQAKNVTVLLNANLTYLHSNENFDAVSSLEVRSLQGGFISLGVKKTVLACGGVENARLLLNSNFDNKLKNIGRYYSFHPRIETGRLVLKRPLKKKNSPYDWNVLNGTLVRTLLQLNEKTQKQLKLANYAALLQIIAQKEKASYAALKRLRDRATLEHEMDGFVDDVVSFLSDMSGAKEQWDNRHGDKVHNEFSLITYIDQLPNPESRVVLQKEKDALGLRKPRVQWDYFATEKESVIEFNRQLALGFGKADIARLQVDTRLNDNQHFEELLRSNSGGGHQIGTTRMSATSATGVVDENCKLHGIANLFCAGSSVFPTTSWVNPTMTIVALSVRLAAHLKTTRL